MSEDAESVGATERSDLSPNSALVWMPVMEATAEDYGVHVPDSATVPIDAKAAFNFVDGDASSFNIGEIESAADSLGYPAFVRTDITSAKHKGLVGIRARDADELRTAVSWAIEANAMKMGSPWPQAIILREWIDLAVGFYDEAHITDSKRQIAREFRAFASPKELLCVHFYWPEDSIHDTDADDWQQRLESMSKLADADRELFESYATDVAYRVPKADVWSVDFARSARGQWYAIDMALADMSSHPDCPKKEPIQRGEIDV